MKVHDNAAALLLGRGTRSLCRWLGEPTDRPRLIATRIPGTTLEPDGLIALSDQRALHLEFQKNGEAGFGLRMLEYSARLRRQPELRGYSLRHQVIVLGQGYVDDRVEDEGLSFHYFVRYLREEPVEPLLADPLLAPFAVLADVDRADQPAVLRKVMHRLWAEGLVDLAFAARDLAGGRLPADIIRAIWKEGPMPIPTFESYVREEGRAEGLEEGRAEGRVQAVVEALQSRFDGDDRIPAAAERLSGSSDWLNQILAATSLDDLLA